MEWQVILLLVAAIAFILFPLFAPAYDWYRRKGGIYAAIQVARKRKAAARGHKEDEKWNGR